MIKKIDILIMIGTNQTLNTSEPNIRCQPIDIAFRNISYSVEVEDKEAEESCLPCCKKTTEKILLRDLSGIFKAGELTAIMGASGAGKTTLLNALSCRINAKSLSGTMTTNGVPYNQEVFGDFANYVMQQDVLMETLTVRETLELAANLKLNLSEEEKQ